MVGEVSSEPQLLRKSKQWEEKWRAMGFTSSWREIGTRKTPFTSVGVRHGWGGSSLLLNGKTIFVIFPSPGSHPYHNFYNYLVQFPQGTLNSFERERSRGGNLYLWRTCFIQTLSQQLLVKTLQGIDCYPHLADEETEAQKG